MHWDSTTKNVYLLFIIPAYLHKLGNRSTIAGGNKRVQNKAIRATLMPEDMLVAGVGHRCNLPKLLRSNQRAQTILQAAKKS